MKFNFVIVSVTCLLCLLSPVSSTGPLAAKIASGIKNIGSVGSGALGLKGAILKGAGSLLEAKAAAVGKAANFIADIVHTPAQESTMVTSNLASVEGSGSMTSQDFTSISMPTIERLPLNVQTVQAYVSPIEAYPLGIQTISLPSGVRTENKPTETQHGETRSVLTEHSELLSNKLSGIMNLIHGGLVNKKMTVAKLLHGVKSSITGPRQIIYKIVPARRTYSMPLVKKIYYY